MGSGNAMYMWGKGLHIQFTILCAASPSVASSRALMYPKGYDYAYRLPFKNISALQ